LSPRFVFSQETEFQVRHQDSIFGVHFINEKTGWIVGDNGLICKTTNNGKTWKRIQINLEEAFNDITFIDNDGWLIGENGIILHTKDAGLHWESQKSQSKNNLMRVLFVNRNKGFIIGDGEKILWTMDGGTLWKHYNLDWRSIMPRTLVERNMVYPVLNDIFFLGEDHGWIVGDFGLVLYTSDGGKQWELLRAGLCAPLFSVFFKDPLEGWAVGQNGLLIHTSDGGKTWSEVSIPVKLSLFKIRMAEGNGVIVGDFATVLLSNDNGKTWGRVRVEMRPPLPWFLDFAIIQHSSSLELVFVGKGTVRKIDITPYIKP